MKFVVPLPRSSFWVRVMALAVSVLGVFGIQRVACGASGGVTITAEKSVTKRQPPAALSSLPAPKARGPLRILLVDDDCSPNNNPGDRHVNKGSDDVFRQLAAAAVGGDASRWSVEIAETYQHGPAFERLRDYNVVIWYTGGSYGGAPDNNAVLSLEDEKTARRYLEETGGAFILISPGYVNNLSYGSTWTSSPHPFLKDVMGVDGFAGLVQRFTAGRVRGHDGSDYVIEHPGVAEAQFSAVNSNGAAIVFTATLDPRYTAEGAVPVAVANPYGGGRFVYVGFTFENIPEADRTRAFQLLLAATGMDSGTTVAGAPMIRVSPTSGGIQTIKQVPPPPPAPSGPPPMNLEFSSKYAASHSIRWIATGVKNFEVYRRDAGSWTFLRGGFLETNFTDPSFVAPNSAYKVVAVYADGRRGEAVLEYPDPPQPQRPTGLRVVQNGAESVQIDWVNVPQVGRYRIFGPGVPGAGIVIQTGTISDPGYGGRYVMQYMPVGVHDIRVEAVYQLNLSTPVYASAKVAINSDRGRYRMVFIGFKVDLQGPDDIIDADGKGQEVFAGAFVAQAPSTGNDPATQLPSVRTLVYGDSQGFTDRIRAGSAGSTGGLRTGDLVPSASLLMPVATAAVESDRFPLRLWEGELVNGGQAISIVPVLVEWGAVDHGAWGFYSNHWPVGNVLQKLAGAMRTNLRAPLAPQALYGTVAIQDFSRAASEPPETRPVLVHFGTKAGFDRPIGLVNTSGPGYIPEYAHNIMGFVLTRERIEAALGSQSFMRLEQRWSDQFSGSYTGYFQIDRLSAPPVVLPPETPVATALPVTPPLIIAGTAIVNPLPPATPAPTITQLPADGRIGTQTVKTLEPIPEPPAGPAPTQATISSEHAARHIARWQANGATTFDLFRKVGDQWITVVAGTTFIMAQDSAFVAPNTVYQIVGHHPDGRVGKTEINFATPAQPHVPQELKVAQTGDRKVKVTWKPDSDVGSTTYLVFGPGLPAAGKPVPWSVAPELTLEVTNVPEGSQTFRVAKQYGTMVAPDARATTNVVAWSGHYRMVLLGFRVGRKTTDDDIFDGDGRGDEVFFSAYRIGVSADRNTWAPLGVVQSVVMGDVNRFSTRVQAGAAGPTGGIRSGDVIPSTAALSVRPGIAATNDRLPLLLWDGWLSNTGESTVVAVTGWEWDNASQLSWNSWVSWWTSPAGSSGVRMQTRTTLSAAPNELRYVPLTYTFQVEPEKPLYEDRLALPPAPGTEPQKEVRYTGFNIGGRPLVTRPLGAIKRADTDWFCIPHGFPLTRNNLERTLGTQTAAIIEVPLATQRGPTVRIASEQDESEYTIVVQIERVEGVPLYP